MTVALLDRADLRKRVGTALAEFLDCKRAQCSAIDQSLLTVVDAVRHFVLGGGKRLRPAFAYWGYRAAGGPDQDSIITAVSALELVQASALIHDDVIDASDTRRGEPSVHRRFAQLHQASSWNGAAEGFGTAAAILLGDLCLVWSDELLHAADLDDHAFGRARRVFDQMRTEVTLGQYLDVSAQVTGDTSPARASLIARYKSAKYTVERPLLLGQALAGDDPQIAAAYTAYGLPLGEAFQLRDDVLGVFGDPEVTGKPAGDDLREGKRTYLVATALEHATGTDQDQLVRWLGDPDLDSAGVERLREIILATGALARTEQRIKQLHRDSVSALLQAPLDPQARQVLLDLADAATQRNG